MRFKGMEYNVNVQTYCYGQNMKWAGPSIGHIQEYLEGICRIL